MLRYLVTDSGTSQPAVILMTANLSAAVDTADALPVRCVLPKRFDIHHLADQVRARCPKAKRADSDAAQNLL